MAKSRLESVKLDTLFADFTRNPRWASAYDKDDKEFKLLTEAIDGEGFRSDKPLVVAKLKGEDGKNRYRVIQGHRRYAAALEVNRRHNGTKCTELPCIVYEGLDEVAETNLMIDHFLIKGLSEGEQYLAVKRLLMNNDWNEDKVANQIGKSRGFVQRRKWIALAPTVVETEYLKRCKGEEALNLNDKNLQELNKARNVDITAGRDTTEGGPAFNEAWENLTTKGRVKEKEPVAKTRVQILEMCNGVKDPIATALLKWAAGEPVNLNDSVDELRVLRAKATSWDDAAASNAATA